MPDSLTRKQILSWLRQTDEAALEELWRLADETRRQCVGDAVHLRGLVEFSNHCSRQCLYCGLRKGNRALQRYRMTADEIRACAEQAVGFGFGTVVLQSGEEDDLDPRWMADLVRSIKAATPLAITLSLGERTEGDLALWREAGADRFLLRFETSDPDLFRKIHPPRADRPSDRIALLRRIKALGYETGSGVMIGLPGQTYETLAADIELFRELELDMIGVGPYIPHAGTPLAKIAEETPADSPDQVPADELTTYKVVALARLIRPAANIPSTTALATLNRESGRELGLSRGANVVMPNLTPTQYRKLYEVYPNKACIFESDDVCFFCLSGRIASIGRTLGTGRGDAAANYRKINESIDDREEPLCTTR